MAKLDLKIVNGHLASSAGVFPMDIGIKGGKIASTGEWGGLTTDAEEIMEAKEKIVLPGGVDTHVHSTDPPLDFDLVSQAGALGGVTTIVDMPFQRPLTTDPASFDIKLNSINPKAYVDFALWGTCTAENVETIVPLKEKGVVGYKLVMQDSVAGIMPYHDDGVMCEALGEVKNLVSLLRSMLRARKSFVIWKGS